MCNTLHFLPLSLSTVACEWCYELHQKRWTAREARTLPRWDVHCHEVVLGGGAERSTHVQTAAGKADKASPAVCLATCMGRGKSGLHNYFVFCHSSSGNCIHQVILSRTLTQGRLGQACTSFVCTQMIYISIVYCIVCIRTCKSVLSSIFFFNGVNYEWSKMEHCMYISTMAVALGMMSFLTVIHQCLLSCMITGNLTPKPQTAALE